MIREKGEALSPVKINRNVWSNSAVRVQGLLTVSKHLLLLTSLRRERKDEGGGEDGKAERTEEEEEEEEEGGRTLEEGRKI